MADLKQIKVGDTTYNIEPYTAYLPLSGGTINANNSKAPLILKGGASNWNEGLRIIPTNNWATILLAGTDANENTGTSAKSWSIHNYDGSFYISKNGSDTASVKLSNTDGTWRVNDNTIIHSGNIGSQNVNYANSAGSVAWDNISSKPITITQRNNDSPVSGAYAYGTYVTMRNTNNWFEIYAPHMGTSSSRVYMQTGWDNDRQGWKAIAWTSDIPTSLPANGGNADTLDGKHASDFYLSSSNITNLPINGGIYWNPYVESSTDGSDAASITVIKDGNGNGGTVLQIKQANDNNDIVNVVAGDLKLNGVSVSTNGHTHSSVSDIGNSTATTFAYSKSGLNYGDYTWLAGWNGYELRAVNKSQFATANHSHSNYVTTNTEQVISGKKTFNDLSANTLNTSYISYINNATGLTIAGPWDDYNEQAILKFVGGKIQGYSHYDDGNDQNDFGLSFEFPYGASLTASSGIIDIKGTSYVKLYDNHCFLKSTSDGWVISGTDQYGNVYPETSNMGHIGLPANHFYQGYINQAYVYSITPIDSRSSSAGSNIGYVGTSSKYFSSGAFKTIYRTSESGLSDIRSKQNISNNDLNALNIINNLNIINFQYDDDVKAEARNKKQRLKAINTMKELPKTKETKELRKELQKIIATPNNEDMITIGVSAQQLQELLPKKYQKTFIQKESTNQYADQLFIRENRLVYLSFKAIQEQEAIIESLEEKINLLEEKINALEDKMKKEVN